MNLLKEIVKVGNYFGRKGGEVVIDGFYQTHNEVLKFDVDKDIEKIRFNHYISRKENLQRIKGGLPRGEFYLTINVISVDLKVTFAEARGFIKKFSELGIISNIYTPPRGCKSTSIWKYNAISVNNDVHNEESNDNNNEERSGIKGLKAVNNNGVNNEKSSDVNNSKKDYFKNKIQKNINTAFSDAEQIESLWSKYPNKLGKKTALKKLPRLVKEYGYEQMVRTVERYTKECIGKELQFIKHGDTFFNGGYLDYTDENYNAKELITSDATPEEIEMYRLAREGKWSELSGTK